MDSGKEGCNGKEDYSCKWHMIMQCLTGVPCAGDAVYSCGSGQNGRLGLGSQTTTNSFASIEALEGMNVFKIDCGLDHSLVLSEL